jgi:hypothetical protein
LRSAVSAYDAEIAALAGLLEAARLIKSKNPHSMVEVKDLQSGAVTAVALRPG